MRECYIRILASYYYQYQYRYRSRERETQGHTQSAGATTRHRTSSKLHYIHRVGAHAPSLPAIVSRVPFAHTLIAAAVAVRAVGSVAIVGCVVSCQAMSPRHTCRTSHSIAYNLRRPVARTAAQVDAIADMT